MADVVREVKMCGFHGCHVVKTECKCFDCKIGYSGSKACQNCEVWKDYLNMDLTQQEQYRQKCAECMQR